MNKLGITLGLTLMALLLGCDDEMKAHYATTVEAANQRAFERGWLPDVLRPDATDIEEFHDLDTNHGGATFRYTDQLVQRLQHSCSQVAANEGVHSPFNSWPQFLHNVETSAQLESRGIITFRCGVFLTAVDSKNRLGYFWH